MSANISGVSLWLADFHLLATALLAGVLVALALMKQPARRMAMMKATIGALAALAVLSALPGWSAIHLMTQRRPHTAPLTVDSSLAVPEEQSVNQLIPHINVDRIPREMPEAPVIVEPLRAADAQNAAREIDWWMAAAIAHATGSAAVVLWLIGGAVLARRIRRGASVAPADVQRLLQRVVGNESLPQLLLSETVATPVAVGVSRPSIILPVAIAHIEHDDQLSPILAHEWAHLRNDDLKTLAASRLLLVLLWPQPLYWLLRRGLRLDQEALADAAAAEVAGRVEYAERLIEWARRVPGTPGAGTPRLAGAVGLWEGRTQLKRRIALLLNEKFSVMRTCSRRWRGSCFVAMALAAVGLSLVTLQPAIQAADDKSEPPTEATEVDRDAPPNGAINALATIAGKIVLEDGSPAKVKGRLYSEAKSKSYTRLSTEEEFIDKFTVEVTPGTVWLKYWAAGYAPAWAGPLEVKSGQVLEDVRLVLKDGSPATVLVRNEDGAPIAGTTLMALPIINSNSSGPSVKHTSNEQGAVLLEHLADATYQLNVSAPGYEPLRQDAAISALPKGVTRSNQSPIVVTMKRSQPTTGVVLNADGSSAKGAVLRFRVEAYEGHSNSGGPGFGEVAATADDQGRFVLDELAAGRDYLFLVETADKAREMAPPIVAGMKDIIVKMAPRRDLKGRLIGDLSKLPERKGKRFVGVRQRIEFKGVNGFQSGDLIGEDAYVTPTVDGGEFTYEGLVDAPVEVTAGEETVVVRLEKAGVTEVAIEVGAEPLLKASVVDQDSGEPLREVSVLAGTNPLDDAGWQWQPHTIHTFRDGEIQWPPPGRRGYDDQIVRIEAPGYVPMHVRATAGKTPRDLKIRMVRDAGVHGQVVDAEGKPAGGARVAIGMTNSRTVYLNDGTIELSELPENASPRDRWSRPVVVEADADGRFQLPTETAEHAIVAVAHEKGFVAVDYKAFAKAPKLALEPWGSIDGQVQWGEQPGAGVALTLGARTRLRDAMLLVGMHADATSDESGRFSFKQVPPGPAQLSRVSGPLGEHGNTVMFPIQFVDVKSGEPTQVVLGGRGRPVIGRLTGREKWDDVRVRIAPNAPHIGFPGDNEQWQAQGEFLNSPAGKTYRRSDVKAAVDGTFRIEGVPPENYQLFVTAVNGDLRPENVGYAKFSIDTLPGGASDEPLDLGEISVKADNTK